LTEASGTVDAGGLWLPISALAVEKRVSKQAISKRVARLKAQGLLQTRAGARGSIEINVAEFDRITGETTDLARSTSHAAPPAAPAPVDDPDAPIYTKEQARKAAYTADLAKLELDERLGRVIQMADVESAMIRAASAIVRQMDQLPSRTDDIASAVAAEGASGVRRILKTIARELRETVARELTLAAAEGHEA